jgi:hypothetical protein
MEIQLPRVPWCKVTSVPYPLPDEKAASWLTLSLYDDKKSTAPPPSFTTSSSVLVGYECVKDSEKGMFAKLQSDMLYGEVCVCVCGPCQGVCVCVCVCGPCQDVCTL